MRPRQTPSIKRASLRRLLEEQQLAFLMEAHNGLSARIVEESGFEAIWASGLAISASLGVRDSNEASWTQVLDVVEFMADATDIPILVDGDTGYGNFNNFRRLVRKLEQRGIAGVCIEDKLFPKTNSFLGDDQALADIVEFCGKIKAGKDSQSDPDFVIVARIEALVANRGQEEALARAEAFHEAGADALVIHSKKSTADEVLEFCALWKNRCPVIVIPTKYHQTPTADFEAAGVAGVIWANHNLRASISAMRETSRAIFESRSIARIEDRVARLGDVFELTGNAELEEAERRYLNRTGVGRAIILAAARGGELDGLTRDRPKCMIDIRGRSILARQCDAMKSAGVGSITAVTGWMAEAVVVPGLSTRSNLRFAMTGEVASLAAALDLLNEPTIVSFGDILYPRPVLDRLISSEEDIVLVVDDHPEVDRSQDAVMTSRRRRDDWLDEAPARVVRIGRNLERSDGRWIGLMKFSAKGAEAAALEIRRMEQDGSAEQADLAALVDRLIAAGMSASIVWVSADWFNINDAFDLAWARNMV